MKITYLDHSGFAVEQGETLLVFDEYNPRPAPGRAGLAGGVVTEADVRAHARSALFLSHSHSDHYCREVLALPLGRRCSAATSRPSPAAARRRGRASPCSACPCAPLAPRTWG